VAELGSNADETQELVPVEEGEAALGRDAKQRPVPELAIEPEGAADEV
jgi:hypothetical protein